MSRSWTGHLLAICAYLIVLTCDAESTNYQLKLWRDLMTDYDKNLKPQLYAQEQLDVKLYPTVYSIESLDEKEQVLTVVGGLSLQWIDHSLTWNPADYGYIYRLIVDGNNIWRPEVILGNGANDVSDISLTEKSRVQIFPDGLVSWGPTSKWKTGCTVDLTNFPFDEQTCKIQFSNWVYGAAELNFTVPPAHADFSKYLENGEWDLLSSEVTSKEEVYSGEGWVFIVPTVETTLSLKRKPSYFMMNLVVPSLFMTLMTLLVFCLPPDAGEKMSLGITNLLSYSVMILMISDVTPRTSDSIPTITYYIIFSMGLSAFALFATTLVLVMHHHSPEQPVPRWVHSCILKGLGTLLCVKSCCGRSKTVEDNHAWANKVSPIKSHGKPIVSKIDNQPNGSTLSLPSDVVEFVRMLQMENIETKEEERNKKDWIKVARVIDRFFLVFYCVFIVLSTMILFIQLA